MDWIYNNATLTEIPEKAIGFVYIITNLTNGKRYIGKKNLYFRKVKQVKGKKKRYNVDSDWKEYYGSSSSLLEDVNKLGKENFKREIIRFCDSKGAMTYYETREIFVRDAILSEDYYNDWCMCRVKKSHIK